MVDIINNLYNLALGLLAGCVILLAATIIYVLGVIRYCKKHMIIEKILIKNVNNTIIELNGYYKNKILIYYKNKYKIEAYPNFT